MKIDFTRMKDTAVFEWKQDGNWQILAEPFSLYFKLDHFCGVRPGLFCYATKEHGGQAAFSELKVMELLWEEGELRAGEIVPILSARVGWNRNTTYTIIKKCVEKGAIRRIEPKFVCQPLVTKEQTQVYEINALAERLFDGSLEKLRKVVEEMV